MDQAKTGVKNTKKNQACLRAIFPLLLAVVGFVLIGMAAAFVIFNARSSGAAPKVAGPAGGPPSLKADKGKIDFGDVKLGKFVNASFQLTNTGSQPVRLTEVPYIQVVKGC